MPLDAPFRLGPFMVDTHGRLQPSDPDSFPTFNLAWRGCPVYARLNVGGASRGDARLALSAIIGRVPSTAGGDAARNQERRTIAFGALRGLESEVIGSAHLRLLPDHRFVMEANRPLELPVSAGDLVTQITSFLLDLGPYLDLLAEADVPVEPVGAAPPAKVGTVNT